MTERRSWLAVVAVYVAIFGAILWTTHGLPYAVDNNESFSSLWHARNLFQTRFALTKGLPDEVAAWHAAASPYIHSHQGDFPRLYSFLLYVLGARSIESQIWLTTFTVGLAAILFAFRFLRTLGPPSFAVICCLVLITDYALLGQWQVNTYRVWYGFFFFSSLLWACRPARLGWGLLNFACLCYGEYVYAAFVCLSAALFAGWLHRREIRLALRAWTAIAGGGAVAAAILAVQLTAYMGWDNVVRDFHYTLTARNVARDADFAAQAAAFYKQHRIIFLQNYLDAAPLRHFSAFASSLYFSHLQFYTPCLCFSALAVLAGAAIARLPRVGPRQILGVALLGAAWICFDKRDTLLQSDFRGSWLAVFPERWSQVVEGAVFFGAALFGLAAAWSGSARLFRAKGRIVHLAALSGCVLGAYAIVYRIFTGYVFSGYLNRQAPFLVFWTDVLLGASIYLIVSAARAQSRAARLGATALAAGFALLWGTAQARYVSAVPPTNYHFLKLLAKPPYRDHSFVTNTYAAPLANQTHSWAYPDKTIFTGRVRLGPHGFEIERDLTYLWFADRDTNPAYAKPDFGMLIAQPSSIAETLLWTLERQGGQARPAIAFGNSGVVGRATSPLQPFLADTFMASDGLQYSIVKFDWDYPPYLKPVGLREPNSSLRARRALTEQTLALHHRWRIRLTVLPRASAPAAPQYVPIDEATIDDRPVFAAEAFRRAGWQGADATRPKVWSVDPALALPLEAYGAGDVVRLRLRSVAGGGRIRIEINDAVETIDLGRLDGAPTEIVLTPAAPYGQHTVVPNFAPGS
ncbi:MAG TPA: hypothetical protein VHV47_07545, partial [Opitutaceae bacterium]|nr:hypothetical protein [Opitutaceae bacterium]